MLGIKSTFVVGLVQLFVSLIAHLLSLNKHFETSAVYL